MANKKAIIVGDVTDLQQAPPPFGGVDIPSMFFFSTLFFLLQLVFDMHDNVECGGAAWLSSKYGTFVFYF